MDRGEFERMLGEADRPAPVGVSYADSLLGAAVRRWCAPPLGLPAGAPLETYLDRRADLGPAEVARRLLGAAGLSYLLVDTGIGGTDGADSDWWSVRGLASAAGAVGREVVRLESVAEDLADSGVAAADFADAYVDALAAATRDAVAVKSILGYRHGFDVDPRRPSRAEVTAAARDWLLSRRDVDVAHGGPERPASVVRLRDEVLLRFVLWSGVDRGLPVQLHTGFGDRDLRLPSVNPALLQPLIEAVEPLGTPLVLLHCYPYQREAGWLAAVYPPVYVDIGLTVGQVGARADAILGEFCELAPFGKLMFSTDAYRLPERYLVGAAQFRHSLGRLLRGWWRDGDLTAHDVDRIALMVGADNAHHLYALDG
ncbi:amidohydrolase family protein [Actinopolymorpha sp. NPDC004070]|uniref:amidohydrolase family protein n=1 Tax=Actinopolymorpha sp. NPDC004070 TaxID=3154548 RepID=UPI00339FDB7A